MSNKQAPRCPGCGKEMKMRWQSYYDGTASMWYTCDCGWRSPDGDDETEAYDKAMQRYAENPWISVKDRMAVRKFVNNRPAVDAEPVRRAQWKAASRRGTLCDTYVCSECGNMVMQAEGYTYSCTYNYCPNCGAKMDEEDMKDGKTD